MSACAIDEDVDLARSLEDRVEQVVERVARSDIDGDEISFAAERFDFGEAFLGFFGDAAAEHDFRACACEADGHGAAKFSRATDDDSGFASKPEEILEVRCGLHGCNFYRNEEPAKHGKRASGFWLEASVFHCKRPFYRG